MFQSVRHNIPLPSNMKLLIVFALVAAAAAQKPSDVAAAIVRSTYESDSNGFQYSYETGNGIVSSASGVVKEPNSENPVLEVKGGYRYIADDGSTVELSYIANENGFQPSGNHLPVPPPIPEAIQRSLEYIAAHPPKPESNVVGVPYRARPVVATLFG